MTRVARAVAAGWIVAAAAALSACSSAAPPDEGATLAPAAAAAARCLADHSPWVLDLDTAYRDWRDAVPDELGTRGGGATGTARLTFTSGADLRWSSSAERVVFELFFDDGGRETASTSSELAGRYRLRESGGLLELTSVQAEAQASTATATASDGTPLVPVPVPPPVLPWDAPAGTRLAFTCTEHRLVIEAEGGVPADWNLYPE